MRISPDALTNPLLDAFFKTNMVILLDSRGLHDLHGMLTVTQSRRNLAATKFVVGKQAQAGCDFGF